MRRLLLKTLSVTASFSKRLVLSSDTDVGVEL